MGVVRDRGEEITFFYYYYFCVCVSAEMGRRTHVLCASFVRYYLYYERKKINTIQDDAMYYYYYCFFVLYRSYIKHVYTHHRATCVLY